MGQYSFRSAIRAKMKGIMRSWEMKVNQGLGISIYPSPDCSSFPVGGRCGRRQLQRNAFYETLKPAFQLEEALSFLCLTNFKRPHYPGTLLPRIHIFQVRV